MPYIHPNLRSHFDPYIDVLIAQIQHRDVEIQTGCLTYIIYKLVANLTENKGYSDKSKFRASIQDAHDEFYRRKMIPYEDEKIHENGDVI